LKQAWTDAICLLHPDETLDAFWDHMRRRWPRNARLQIDQLLLRQYVAPRLKAAGVDREVRGLPQASDHAPAWI